MGLSGNIEFEKAVYNIDENTLDNGGAIKINVVRVGGLAGEPSVQVKLIGGTATEGSDFIYPCNTSSKL